GAQLLVRQFLLLAQRDVGDDAVPGDVAVRLADRNRVPFDPDLAALGVTIAVLLIPGEQRLARLGEAAAQAADVVGVHVREDHRAVVEQRLWWQAVDLLDGRARVWEARRAVVAQTERADRARHRCGDARESIAFIAECLAGAHAVGDVGARRDHAQDLP